MLYLLPLSPVHDSGCCFHSLPPKSMRELAKHPPTSLLNKAVERQVGLAICQNLLCFATHTTVLFACFTPNHPLLPVVVNCCSGRPRSAEVPGRYRGRTRCDRNGFSSCHTKRGLNSERRKKAGSFSTCRCYAIDMEMRFGEAARIFIVIF